MPLLWTEKQDVGPSPRVGAAAAFDSARGLVMLHGGLVPRAAPFTDTWAWDGEDWTQVADTGPDARSGHALAFDSGRARLVLFGGIAGDASLRGDTWEWDGENWTQIADTGPDARSSHRLAFDSGRSVTVLFGGNASGSALRGDTWAWDGSNWTQEQDMGPLPRQGHGLAFDTARNQVVLYGGATSVAVVGDTWTWDGAEWTERSHFGPPACVEANMVFDGSSALLYGGASSLTDTAAQVFAGSWTWDGEHWTQRQDIGPGPRWGHALAFDSGRGCAVLYGGAPVPPADTKIASRLLGDTWEEQGTPTAPPPSAARIAALTVDPQSGPVGQPFSVLLTVRLNQALPNDIEASIETSIGSINQPDLILIPAGSLTGQALFDTFLNVAAEVVLTATIGDSTIAALLTVA